jgi:hypothetical protein
MVPKKKPQSSNSSCIMEELPLNSYLLYKRKYEFYATNHRNFIFSYVFWQVAICWHKFDAYEAKTSAKNCVVLLRIIIGIYLVIRLMGKII